MLLIGVLLDLYGIEHYKGDWELMAIYPVGARHMHKTQFRLCLICRCTR